MEGGKGEGMKKGEKWKEERKERREEERKEEAGRGGEEKNAITCMGKDCSKFPNEEII